MQIQFSGIGVVDGRGKLGDSVFFRNRYGAAVREYVIPTNTITAARKAQRDMYSDLCALWKSLDPWMVQEWNAFALNFKRTTTMGHKYYSLGFLQFMRDNFNRANIGLSPLLVPTAHVPFDKLARIAPPATSSTSWTLAGSLVNGGSFVPIDTSIAIFATSERPLSNFAASNRFRNIGYIAPLSDCFSFDFYSQWVAIYGAPAGNARVFIRAKTISNVTGEASSWLTGHFVTLT